MWLLLMRERKEEFELTVLERTLNPSLSFYFLGQTWRGNTIISSGFGDPREKRPCELIPRVQTWKEPPCPGCALLRPIDLGEFMEPRAGPVSSLKIL